MNTPRLKFWPILFLGTFLEGILTLVWLALIPPDAKNAVFLGFSAKRLLMLAFLCAILVVCAFCAWFSWRRQSRWGTWLDPQRRPGTFRWLTVGSLVAAFGLELGLLFLRYYDPARFMPLYIRFRPLLLFLFLACLQTALVLLVTRFGTGLRRFWRRAALWSLGWVGLTLLVLWGLSPSGGGALHTWWYIQTFDPARYELHGADYCAADYSASLEDQYQKASMLRLKLANIDRPKALLAIFNKVTSGATTNTEKHLKLLSFIQKSSYHTDVIASYSEGDWVYDPLVLLELGDMWCTQGAILAIDLFGSAGYPGRLVQLAHHQIAEIYYDGDWHYFDTDSFGDGETVRNPDGNIPSVAEMSRGDQQRIDALPAYQEFNVMDCRGDGPQANYYPSYFYFSSQAYKTDVPQNYYIGRDSPYAFEHGWKAVGKIAPEDVVSLNDLPAKFTPSKPGITQVLLDAANATLTISFNSSDQDDDLAGYRVFISGHSRGWDYNRFYGDKSAKAYWADRGGWKPEMYAALFALPPSDEGLLELEADATQVTFPVRSGMTYYITVMATDAYGLEVGRVLFPESNELKITVP